MDARILTHWEPSGYDWRTIQTEFTELLCQLDIEDYCPYGPEVRSPEDQRNFPDTSVTMRWHRDNDHGYGSSNHLIMCWSNKMPTEIQDAEGNVMQPAPFEVVIFDNSTLKHRGPAGINHTDDRWFVRACVKKTERTMELLNTTSEKGTN